MNKKILAAGAGLAVLALSASFVLTMGKTGATTLAGEVTHSHGSSCTIHHYAQVDPTSEKSGVKEYWICCSDPTHKVSFSNPGVGNITDATHDDDFAIDSSDDRYLAPYTFPEVFYSQTAYETPVTIADGKITSSTGTIKIKAGVLKDAYTHGYTHMKFHSNAESSDVTNICGTQNPTWASYNKIYKNNQDNRYWLKSFSDAGEGLKIASRKVEDEITNANIILSDIALYKSSATESWGGGADAQKYIAIENGELVIDNCGSNQWGMAAQIPESLMGTGWASVSHTAKYPIYRPIYLKKLAEGTFVADNDKDGIREQIADCGEQINVTDNAGTAWSPYKLAKSDGTEEKNSEGFANLIYNGVSSVFGLDHNYYYKNGTLGIMLSNPSAYAIRLDYDLDNLWIDKASYDIMPLPFSKDGKTRVSLINYAISSDGNQANISFPNSKAHKGVAITVTSTLKPKSTFLRCNWNVTGGFLNIGSSFVEKDGVYTYTDTLTFDENSGLGFAARFDTASATGGILTFEYSWID